MEILGTVACEHNGWKMQKVTNLIRRRPVGVKWRLRCQNRCESASIQAGISARQGGIEHIRVVGESDAQHPGSSWARINRGESGRDQEQCGGKESRHGHAEAPRTHRAKPFRPSR